mmetsp:Transcript_25380/g.76219  ORF Transcript_25380/g.76219 Transcript_25380/m.76219 type:complete len:402 (-) Transcript_25380:33-1238(-)
MARRGRQLPGRGRAALQGHRGHDESRRQGRRVLPQGEVGRARAAGRRQGVHPLWAHVAGREPRGAAPHARRVRARRPRPQVPGPRRGPQGPRVGLARRRYARAHARPGRVAHAPRQGVRGLREPPRGLRGRPRGLRARREVRGRDGRLQRAPRGLPRRRLAGLRGRLRGRGVGRPIDAPEAHDADRALRRSGGLLPRALPRERRRPGPRARLLAVRVTGLLRPEAQGGRGGLVGHAPQGEPHRLRELRGQPGRGERVPRAPRGQAARVAAPAGPLGLHGAADRGRAPGPLVPGRRRMPEGPGQADAERGQRQGRPGRELGRVRRGHPDGAAPRGVPEPLRGPQAAHAHGQAHHRGRHPRVRGRPGRGGVRESGAAGHHAPHVRGRLRRVRVRADGVRSVCD